MKKSIKFFSIIFFAAVILFSINSCNCIQGEGPIQSENRDLNNFDGIDLGISAHVYLEKSDTYTFSIEAQENLLDEIETFVSGGILRIQYENVCVTSRKAIRIYIGMPELTEIEIGGSGDVVGSGVFECRNLKLRISGSGSIDLEAIAKSIDCKISGSGNIDLSGSTDELEVVIRGSGNVDAVRSVAKKVFVSVNGSGNSKVYALNYLDVDISGSGDVLYKGRPDIDSDINGSGDIRRIR